MARLAAFTLLCAAGVGCRPRAPHPPEGALSESSAELSLVLGDELRAAREEGATELSLGLVGVGIPGDSLGGVIELPDAECVLVLGRGAAGVQDVDVFAFADDGTVLASDESPSERATLILCPPQPPRAYVSGRLASGFGLVAVTAQTVPLGRVDAVAKRFGALPNRAPEARAIDGGWAGLEERLTEHRRSLGGQWESLRKVALPLDPRAYAHVSTRVEADRCIDALVIPSDDVAHLELEVLEANGRWIGSGRARGGERNLTLCSSEARDVTLRCRPHAGRGFAALVLSRSAVGASRELAAHSARFDLRPVTSLAELRRQHGQHLEALGYAKPQYTREGRLEPERRSNLNLPLARGCSRIDVLTAAPVSSIRAWLWDAAGHLIAEDGRSLGATLFACGAKTLARLDLETVASGGEFVVEVRHTPQLPEAAESRALAAGRLLGMLDARGLLGSLSRLPELETAEVSETDLVRFELALRAGRCVELGAALGPDVSGLELRIFERAGADSDRDATEAIGYGARAATARVCAVKPPRDRLLTVELRANVGRGAALWTSYDFDPNQDVSALRGR